MYKLEVPEQHFLMVSLSIPLIKSVFYGNHKLHCLVTSEPVLMMWDVKAEDLKLLLDFMYQGQVNVAHENLNSFLALAERLQVRGLTSNIASNNSHRTTTNSLHSMDLFCSFFFLLVKNYKISKRVPMTGFLNTHFKSNRISN